LGYAQVAERSLWEAASELAGAVEQTRSGSR
jgi:hypothetical protein